MFSGCLLHSGLKKKISLLGIWSSFILDSPLSPLCSLISVPLTPSFLAAKSPLFPSHLGYTLYKHFLLPAFPSISYRDANRFFRRKAFHSPVNLVHLKCSSWRLIILISILKGLRWFTLKKPVSFSYSFPNSFNQGTLYFRTPINISCKIVFMELLRNAGWEILASVIHSQKCWLQLFTLRNALPSLLLASETSPFENSSVWQPLKSITQNSVWEFLWTSLLGFPGDSDGKNLSAVQDWVWSLGW